MRIFHDGRTGSIRIIAREDADHARAMADDDGADGSDMPQPHTRGGMPVVHVTLNASSPVPAAEASAASSRFPDAGSQD